MLNESPPALSGDDLYLFGEGTQSQAYRMLGALPETRRGKAGFCFRVWAPNADQAAVVGDFNGWDGRVHPMRCLGDSGVWEVFVPGLPEGSLYKFEIRNRHTGALMVKADPYARAFEKRPATAAKTVGASRHAWSDSGWLARRAEWDWLSAPLSIYEMHAGSWMRHPDGRFYSWRELADRLVPYVKDMGYTHVEFMPLMEHPLDESWGYQCTGFFAPTSRFGAPDDLRFLVDAFHAAGIGVILDWVPGHFPSDAWALAHFDGTALYEHEDPRLKVHPDWGTHVFNFGRNEVRAFLLSSAHYWLSEFHADGLRVDAVASMLYLDYSRKAGEWLPNRYGGRENLEAIGFLRQLNEMVHREFPGALTIAEESTAWPMVSRPTYVGGLGFSMKWNMGWMNDTLDYMANDPVHRRYHHDRLTFGQLYAYSENFVLPLSHDEVVHGKGSLLGKMPGDDWQRHANLRLLLACQMASPGKKLLFMGGEIAQPHEWRSREEMPWHLLQWPPHEGTRRLARDLNHLYAELPALHELDFSHEGFEWIDCHDADQSVVSWLRRARDGRFVVCVLNFTPVPRGGYRLGVPHGGDYREIFNSDSRHYGGGDLGNAGRLFATGQSWMGRPASIELTLPPLAAVFLAPVSS
ncbi:MAG: 1,4-alpha-glucan branching protein GlgB [Candidatus Nitricoxidivorans perseverans]|uniref:1,4-alpha-glucan branching enzyme GlgB n=1 Tax=Candidatus Nitricoxidivorans perseverans TaxID=2975601 RepID=A0AA49FIX7_9PROT|nr:MAG: 1,4-alpha-glucan branching protein GlgB [Candidatus Nitricoxidivorans perseverans]